MSPNRALMESLASDHQARLHAHAKHRSNAVRTPRAGARTRAGWLLVGIGMRMVLGRGTVNTHLKVAGGR